MPPPKRKKVCVKCGEEFLPRSGRQTKCNKCRGKPTFNAKSSSSKTSEGYERQRTKDQRARGRALRGSPLALKLDERVRKRLAEIEEEEKRAERKKRREDDAAT